MLRQHFASSLPLGDRGPDRMCVADLKIEAAATITRTGMRRTELAQAGFTASSWVPISHQEHLNDNGSSRRR